MADDSIKVYDWALQKNKEILISGYYGFRNSGDDALLKAIIQDLKKYKESPNIVVLSANPEETMEYYRVKSINRLNLISVLKHMRKADMLISGGGTLIQDRTSTKSLWYYLSIITMALRNNVKVMLYSNGIGPLVKSRNIKRTKNVLEKVNLITLRDEESYKTIRDMGITNPMVKVTADPALGLDLADKNRGIEILSKEGVPKNNKILGVSIRRWQNLDTNFEDEIAAVCDYAYEKYGYYTVFLPMQSSRDLAILQSVKRKMKNKSTLIKARYSVEDVMSIMKCFDICIGMRLHTLIYSAVNAVPLIGIVYDPKISSFMEYTHQKLYLEAEGLKKENLCKMLDECVSNYDTIKNDLKNNYDYLKEQAQLNGKYAIELYEKGSVEL